MRRDNRLSDEEVLRRATDPAELDYEREDFELSQADPGIERDIAIIAG